MTGCRGVEAEFRVQMVRVYSGLLQGLEARLLTVEVDSDPRSFGFYLVGMADSAVREGQLRIQNAVRNAGFHLPRCRHLVNMAPADLRKEGAAYDLTIALGLLAEAGILESDRLGDFLVIGELSLDGRIKGVRGILSVMDLADRQGYRGVIMPRANLPEALWCPRVKAYAFDSLRDVVEFVMEGCPEESASSASVLRPGLTQSGPASRPGPAAVPSVPGGVAAQRPLQQVRGQALAKRALQVAAAGRHNVLLMGPPGCGKTMLAHCFPSLLPPIGPDEAWDLARIYSLLPDGPERLGVTARSDGPERLGVTARSDGPERLNVTERPNAHDRRSVMEHADHLEREGAALQRPFRQPHPSVSLPAMVGGGAFPMPGEVTLAHGGVLFLDELPEFRRDVLEALREPLEQGRVMLNRHRQSVCYPARFVLIAAMNPCPCGYYGSTGDRCRCPESLVMRYQRRISGPLLDRMDLVVCMDRVSAEEWAGHDNQLSEATPTPPTSVPQPPATVAPLHSPGSPLHSPGSPSSTISSQEPALSAESRGLMHRLVQGGGLSMRACQRLTRVAQTMAGMEGLLTVEPQHLMEAYHFRHPRFLASTRPSYP
ncbi:MAG: YifB family Mg chelatase-like AAA ATPase [Bacteroidota bacterium]